ncbi:hypothetical protein D3C85_1524240 [compost metagenome]
MGAGGHFYGEGRNVDTVCASGNLERCLAVEGNTYALLQELHGVISHACFEISLQC